MNELPDIREVPFSQLVATLPEFRELRQEYAARTPLQRRRAADFTYSQAVASGMFRRFAPETAVSDEISGMLAALAIDPDFAPALLAVGSIEHQLGRQEEAMKHFIHLTGLPRGTEDLPEIIDKAVGFLLDSRDLVHAEHLLRAAVAVLPEVASFHSDLGYCAGKQGRKQEALEHARKAIELAPEKAAYWSDLGWTLIENGCLNEAEAALRKATVLAPGETMAEGNLGYLEGLRIQPRGDRPGAPSS